MLDKGKAGSGNELVFPRVRYGSRDAGSNRVPSFALNLTIETVVRLAVRL